MWRELQRRYTENRIRNGSATVQSYSAPVFDILNEYGLLRGLPRIINHEIDSVRDRELVAVGYNLNSIQRVVVASVVLSVETIDVMTFAIVGRPPIWSAKYYDSKRREKWYR